MTTIVDSYIEGLESPQQEITAKLRRIVREAAPEAKETIKWGVPVYEQDGNFCGIDANRRGYVGLQFFQGANLPDPQGLLEGTGKAMRHVKVRQDNMNELALAALVKEAVKYNVSKR